jgi:hypothetical protein
MTPELGLWLGKVSVGEHESVALQNDVVQFMKSPGVETPLQENAEIM